MTSQTNKQIITIRIFQEVKASRQGTWTVDRIQREKHFSY